MKPLARINNFCLEPISLAGLGHASRCDAATCLRGDSEFWSKVYISDDAAEHLMDLMTQETFDAESLYILALSQHLEQLRAIVTW